MPAISIIVPVYNVEKYLAECLDSLLSQSFKDIEIICINDGSTDHSAEILASYKVTNPNIIVVMEQENKGLAITRNVGIAAAKGDYICFVDSDDMLADGVLEKIYFQAQANKQVQVITYETAPLLFEDGLEDPKKSEYYTVKNSYNGIRPGADFLVEMIENKDYEDLGCLLFIKRDWLLENRLTFEPYAIYEDTIFCLECFLKCQYMMHMSIGAYIYRIHANSITTSTYTCRQVKWRIWQFTEVLKRIFLYSENERLVKALVKYAKWVLSSIRTISCALSDSEREKIKDLDSIYELFVDCMGLSGLNILEKINPDLKLEGLMHIIEKSDRVLLYGAGNVARKMYELLKIAGMEKKVVGFAVSDDIEPYVIDGNVSVQCIKDYDCHSVDLLILAAIAYRSEMYKTAKELGFKNMRAIEYSMELLIDKRLLEEEILQC